MASRQKVPKFDFQSQFSMSKIIRIFLNFFFIEDDYQIWRIGVFASRQKVPKFDFQSQSSMSKLMRIFLIFFSFKNMNLGAHFL